MITQAALVAGCLAIGYTLGRNSEPTLSKDVPPAEPELRDTTEIQLQEAPEESNHEDEEESDDDEGDLADGDLSSIKAGFLEQCKLVSRATTGNIIPVALSWIAQVLCVRTDLKMTTGKISAQ